MAVETEASRQTQSTAPAFTVGQVVSRIKALIEAQFPAPMWIEGELSNVSYPASGHIYFSLVDEQLTDRFGQRLVLPCAFYRGMNQNLKFKLADGLKVVCLGQVTTYERQGQYQLKVMRALPKGKGELQLAFEQLKKRLQDEGLFDDARKRPIPALPGRVGIVTSRTGSAIHDMVSKLRGWFHVVIFPVKVQGDGAAREIAAAIGLANRLKAADVLIVGRGGGSVEDLWAFNEEPVARAIAASAIPVISAVGHEDDWTISDYVADLRASTPTDAVKRLVHEQEAFAEASGRLADLLVETMRRALDDEEQHLASLGGRLRLLHPLNQLTRYRDRAYELQLQLSTKMDYTVGTLERGLQALSGRLQALSPLAVLARGYSITTKLPDGRIITSAGRLRAGDELQTLVAKGRIISIVKQTINEPPSEP